MPETTQTPEQHAEQFIKDHAGVILYKKYADWCKTITREPIDFQAFFLILFKEMGAI